jgi:tetratricopeptide (TPR) repeat protein
MRQALLALLFLASFPLFAQRNVEALREYRKSDYQAAIDICRGEITVNPADLDAHVILCWSLVALKRYEEARTWALTGRNINPYDSRIVEILGEIYYFQGRNDDALRSFQEYVNLAPQGDRLDVVYYYTGELYIRLGKFQHADIALSTAVYFRPQNAAWWTRLAYVRENGGNLTGAIAAYEQALTLDARSPDARQGLERTRRGGR